MKFQVNGPFWMPRNAKGLIPRDVKAQRVFWDQVEKAEPGLPDACGCYIFALYPRGGGSKPWYVGMTRRLGFRNECFQAPKLNLYNEAVINYTAAPALFLVSKLTTSGNKFAKCSANGHSDIKTLEDMLIGIAFAQNQKLLNIRGTRFLRDAVVPGVLNTPRGGPSDAVVKLHSLLMS